MSEIIAVLKLLLLPPMVLPILVAAGLVFHKRKVGLPVAAVSLLLFLILSLPITENKIAQYLEYLPPLRPERVQQFFPQALVVIGGGIQRNGLEYRSDATVKTGTLLRLRYAAKLARETGLPVMVSGGRTLDNINVSEAEIMASVLLEEFGIPVVWQEAESRNTAENARLSRRILQQQGIDRIILVTQAYHMPRAESEFRKVGFQVLAAPTDFIGRASGSGGFFWSDWIPSVKALEYGFLLAYESMAILWYSLRY